MAGWIRGGAIVLGGLVALVLAAWLAVLNVPSLQDALMDRAMRAQLDLNRTDLFSDDALRVLICGSSSPMPDRTRAKACTAIIAGGKFYLVDTGPEMWENIMTWRVPAERIGGVFLSHFHSDHIGELGEVNMNSWALGRPGPLKVFGGPGVERVVAGFTEAYALDSSYRTAHHGAELLDPAKGRMEAMPVRFEGPPVVTRNRTVRAFEEDGLTVTAIEVSHSPIEPAYAWRFDYKGRSVVVSGDTAYHPPLAAAAKDADVLVHEAQSNEMVMRIRNAAIENGNARLAKILSDITTYHTTPIEAARIANDGGVKLLILTHFTPPVQNAITEAVFTRGLSEIRSEGWEMAYDGMLVTLPADSKEIEVGDIADAP